MKIALVFPRFRYPCGDPPLGVGYLASFLMNHNPGIEVDILDTTFEPDPARFLASKFKNHDYKIVGISAMTPMWPQASTVAGMVKSSSPESFVVLGGPHPTVLPEESLQKGSVDAVCIGEGEETLSELADHLDSPESVKGLVLKKNGGVHFTGTRDWIDPLDRLPIPALHLLPMDRYLSHWYQLDAVAPCLIGTSVIASRGCPYRCSFCQPTLQTLFGKKVRRRSPSHMVRELGELKSRFSINAFFFEDDTFVSEESWLDAFLEQMTDERLNLKWGCNLRVDLVSEPMLQKLIPAGLVKINIGIESGSERILRKVYQKGIHLDQVYKAFEILRRLNLVTQGYFILGAPGETEAEIRKTIHLAVNSPLNVATFNICTPFPGTDLFQTTKEHIQGTYGDFDYYKRSVYNEKSGASAQRLPRMKRMAYLRFYLSRARLGLLARYFLRPQMYKRGLSLLRRF